MIEKTFTVKNPQGLHMRPAGLLCAEMTKFQSAITLIHDGKEFNGKSVMALMSGGIKCGAAVTVRCDGADEKAAIAAAEKLFESGFGE